MHYVYQGVHGLTVGEKIIHDEHLVCRVEIWFRNEYVVMLLVCEGICLRHILVVSAVCGLALLCEYHRHIIYFAQKGCDGDAASLDGQNLVDFDATEAAFELVGHLAHDVDVNLVVEETVNLEDISLLDHSVREDLLL